MLLSCLGSHFLTVYTEFMDRHAKVSWWCFIVSFRWGTKGQSVYFQHNSRNTSLFVMICTFSYSGTVWKDNYFLLKRQSMHYD